MTCVSPPRLVLLVGAFALGLTLSACSSSGSDGAVGTSGQSDAFVSVDVSTPPFITLENRTGQPLVDVNVGIKAGMLTSKPQRSVKSVTRSSRAATGPRSTCGSRDRERCSSPPATPPERSFKRRCPGSSHSL
jgi:hypothetical protein